MKVLLVIYLVKILFMSASAIQCMDENNKPVDWYIAYKLPEIKHQHKLIKAGVAYIFLTSDEYNSWKFSNISINSTSSILANTLNKLYSSQLDEQISHILYNDQPPNKRSKSNKGHTKGVIMLDGTTGFWLIHSVPHFPELGKSYIFPRTGAEYGQSILCISMNLKNLNKVGIQLQYNEPEIYSQYISSNMKSLVPDLANAANNVTVNAAPWYNILDIFTLNNVQFTSFAKSKKFNKDLYEDLVAPSLKSDLFIETWPNGPGRLESNCTKIYKINNIKSIHFDVANVSFTTTDDHSKWAVSPPTQSNSWLCIGDINRAEHQKVRGGGTLCLNNKQLATDYKKCIETIEDCKKM